MKILNFTHCLLAMLLVGFSACAGPQKMLERGNYDDAIRLAVKKLSGKKKKTKYVLALEEAFFRANQRDLEAAERLKGDGRPENWERIHQLYARIDDRQQKIAPLLPLLDEYGVEANIRLIDVADYMREASRKAAEYLYARAQQHLEAASEGDRLAAREAYDLLRRTKYYFSGAYRDRDRLLEQSRELGTTHIALQVHNESQTLLPAGFEQEMLAFNARDLDSQWRRFHLRPQADLHYDYHVDIRLVHAEVSPSLVQERNYEQAKTIQDGFEYVLDERGNVMKDSLGNDIKIPKEIEVRAQVLETYQQKAATLQARIEIFDGQHRQLINSRPVTAEALFENVSAAFRGDERALSQKVRELLHGRIQPFPSDAQLLFDAAVHLRPEVRRTLDRMEVI